MSELAAAESAKSASLRLPLPNWDRYKIIDFLGAGGMGSVYKAQDLRLNRIVAIKFLRSDRLDAADPHQRRRFETEARAQARIEHPHICKLYDVGVVDGQPYIAMQFIVGSSLDQLENKMSRQEKVRVIRDIAEALHAAHLQGVIHRDLKPANIMIAQREDHTYWPYLMDFGLAREVDASSQTSTMGILGTPGFMSPEQARGDTRIDRRGDVYGLGATLYSALSGHSPFNGNATEVLLDVIFKDPRPMRSHDPSLPKDLDTIVLKCLEKQPELRYESAKALAEDLDRYLAGSSIAARPPSLTQRLGKLARRHRVLFVGLATALAATLILGAVALRARIQAAEQARLGQQLSQEIAKMEWLLRSARQMPLHDLHREKASIRHRMDQLQTELGGYGASARGLAHYALGRGHLALHEYPQALTELQLAEAQGSQSAELHYALGLVLGKHFEQAMYEARLSGGGDWAQRQLKELEPKYLAPAITSLSRSRVMKLDTSEYLEALISFYKRDYDSALQHTGQVLEAFPWLYEAEKLAGDVHHAQALQARDRGLYEQAQKEFSAAVHSYQHAAAIGASDAEVYEALAETWVRQIEMGRDRSQPVEDAYVAAVAAGDNLMAAEPQSTGGLLKKAAAAMLAVEATGPGPVAEHRIQLCLGWADAVLKQDPANPYASETAANCYARAAGNAQARGEDPEPLLNKAIAVLEEALGRSPRFLWGLNDLGTIYGIRGAYRAVHGNLAARTDLERSIHFYQAATELDENYLIAWQNILGCLDELVALSDSSKESALLISRVEQFFAKCQSINKQHQQCYNNDAIFYVRLAKGQLAAGEDPRPSLDHAREKLAALDRLGGSYLDAEQHRALLHYLSASYRLQQKADAAPAITELRSALGRCFAIEAKDALCLALSAQAEWLEADRLAQQDKPTLPSLETALSRAVLATQSPDQQPDAWWTLAETYLRLSRLASLKNEARGRYIRDGLAAAERIFAINPHHGPGRQTQEALRRLAAEVPPPRAEAEQQRFH